MQTLLPEVIYGWNANCEPMCKKRSHSSVTSLVVDRLSTGRLSAVIPCWALTTSTQYLIGSVFVT